MNAGALNIDGNRPRNKNEVYEPNKMNGKRQERLKMTAERRKTVTRTRKHQQTGYAITHLIIIEQVP